MGHARGHTISPDGPAHQIWRGAGPGDCVLAACAVEESVVIGATQGMGCD